MIQKEREEMELFTVITMIKTQKLWSQMAKIVASVLKEQSEGHGHDIKRYV
jgi:predicted Mrr-cat superfamily restriction endonuclease